MVILHSSHRYGLQLTARVERPAFEQTEQTKRIAPPRSTRFREPFCYFGVKDVPQPQERAAFGFVHFQPPSSRFLTV